MNTQRWIMLASAVVIAGLATTTMVVRASEDPLLARAAAALREKRTYRSVLTVQTKGVAAVGFTLDGVVDGRAGVGRFDARFPVAIGSRAVTCAIVATGKTAYVAVPPSLRARHGGKSWVSSDVLGFLPVQGTKNGQLQPATFSSIHDLHSLGLDNVRDTTATRFRGTLDLRGVVPPSSDPRTVAALPRDVPVDVWISSDDLIRQVAYSITTRAANVAVETSTRLEFFDFGVPVKIAVPKADEAEPVDARSALQACIVGS